MIYCTSERNSESSYAPSKRSGAVLLIQENVELRTALRNELTAQGFDVLEAANEQHAEVISRHVPRSIDIFITDRPDYEIACWHRVETPARKSNSEPTTESSSLFVCATFAKPDLVAKVREVARGVLQRRVRNRSNYDLLDA